MRDAGVGGEELWEDRGEVNRDEAIGRARMEDKAQWMSIKSKMHFIMYTRL